MSGLGLVPRAAEAALAVLGHASSPEGLLPLLLPPWGRREALRTRRPSSTARARRRLRAARECCARRRRMPRGPLRRDALEDLERGDQGVEGAATEVPEVVDHPTAAVPRSRRRGGQMNVRWCPDAQTRQTVDATSTPSDGRGMADPFGTHDDGSECPEGVRLRFESARPVARPRHKRWGRGRMRSLLEVA